MPVSFPDSLRLVAASACWGLGTVLSKSALTHFDPYELLIIQLGASVVAMTCALVVTREGFSWRPASLVIASLGVLNPGLAYFLGLTGLNMTSASSASLIWALEPALIVVAARLVLGERVTGRIIGVVGTGAAGVGLVAVGPVAGSLTGSLFVLGGVACCALYAALTRRIASPGSTVFTVLCQHAAALGLAVIVAMTSGVRPIEALSVAPPAARVSAVLSGVLYYGVAFLLFVGALRKVPAAVAGLFINLVPVFGILAAYFVLNERLSALEWLGAGTVVCAMTYIVFAGTDETRIVNSR